MAEGSRFQTGQTITIREIWQDKIWSARPAIVVQDTPELIACYILPNSLWKKPRSAKGERVRPADRSKYGWVLHDAIWLNISLLRLSIPGQRYSVLIFRDEHGLLTRWYINLEEPLVHTRLGFDYYDRILDVILTPDLSSWYWEDEDELEEAVAAGLISPEKAQSLYTDGQDIVELLQTGKSIFNNWANWRPDPAWTVPILPAGWDKL